MLNLIKKPIHLPSLLIYSEPYFYGSMSLVIHTTRYVSPLGDMILAATDKGLCLLEFEDEQRVEKQFSGLQKYDELDIVEKATPLLETAQQELQAYFEGTRTAFTVPLDLMGTDFQKRVWNALLKIPYGSTRTYKEQAIAVGDLKAIRAVAKANGDNKIAIMVPCHRIIGSNDSLVGYAGGLWRKRELLKLESPQSSLF